MLQLLVGIALGILLTLGFQRIVSSRNRLPAALPRPSADPDNSVSADVLFEKPGLEVDVENGIEAKLRQNLRVKLAYDESKVDRSIELERERRPDASMRSLLESAIERWERENR